MIEVELRSADGLSRQVWQFTRHSQYLMLKRFAEERRANARCKFKAEKVWDSSDERSYASSLPRPKGIPKWVVDKALSMIPPPQVTIGWADDKFLARIELTPPPATPPKPKN